MKKKILFLSIMLAGASMMFNTMAQGNFALGIKAGYNSSKFRTDNASAIIEGTENYTFQDAKDEAKGGLLFGAFARIRLVNNLSFQPELLYAKKGGETVVQTNQGSITYEQPYHTWDIPLLAHLKLIDLKVLNIYGVAGPMASLTANEDEKWHSQLNVETFSSNRKDAQWSFQAGGGVEFGSFNLDVRYSWGLGEANKSLEQVNNNLTFSLAYKIFDL